MTDATKTAPAEPARTPDVAAARERVTAALARVAALDAELPRLSRKALDVRREIQRALHNAQASALAEAEQELATLIARDQAIRLREHPEALKEAGDARRAYDLARNPLLTVDEATERLEAAKATLAGLEAERAAVPGRLRDAALDGDVEAQVALGARSEELPLALAAAEQKLMAARRHYADAMAAVAAPGSPQERSWKERATQARQMQVELAEIAAMAARGRAAPVVRTRWQGAGS